MFLCNAPTIQRGIIPESRPQAAGALVAPTVERYVMALSPAPPSPSQPENLLEFVERLRQQAEAFQRTVEEELRTVRARIEELRVGQAKRRGHER
jgi:hypothetical protein